MAMDDPASLRLRALTVLVVEDDATALDEMTALLERRVGRVLAAGDGIQGLAAFRAERPGLVVTDIRMPRMDGLAMAGEMRGEDPSVPIIVATAFERTDYLLQCIDLGIDAYVLKPVRPERLLQALRTCAARILDREQAMETRRLEAEAVQLRHQAALRVLLGGLAHDYNNLLQGIFGFVEVARNLLPRDEGTARLLELSADSEAQTRHLGRRLRLLLDACDPLEDEGPLGALLKSRLDRAVAGKAVEAELDLRDGGCVVRHNAASLARLLDHLLENALEAMQGKGRLRLAAERAALPQGEHLRVTLEDSGPGIRPEILPLVFEPYFTTKPRTSAKGVGLGLTLCETIARAHGGSLTADSLPAGGARFTLLLPALSR